MKVGNLVGDVFPVVVGVPAPAPRRAVVGLGLGFAPSAPGEADDLIQLRQKLKREEQQETKYEKDKKQKGGNF